MNDVSGNGNSGTMSGGSSIVTGQGGAYGTALQLDGTTGWVDIPDFNIAGDFSIGAWVNLTGTIDNKDCIVGQGAGGLAVGGQNINFFGDQANFFRKTGGGGNAVTQVGTLPAGAWAHYTFVHSGTDMLLYLDGALNNTGTGTFDNATWGNFIPKAIGLGGGFTEGMLDDIVIYDYALTASEVTDIYSGNYFVAVPEPSAYALGLGLAGLGFVFVRRRRRSVTSSLS